MPTETEIREAVILQREILGILLFLMTDPEDGTAAEMWELLDPDEDDREKSKEKIQRALDALQARGTIQQMAGGAYQIRQDVLAILQWGPKAIEILGDLGRWDNPATSDGNWDRLNDIQEAAGPVITFARDEGDREALRLQAERERIAAVKAEREARAPKPATPVGPEVWIKASPKRDMVILAMMDLARPATRGEILARAADAWGDAISPSTVDNVLVNWSPPSIQERQMFTIDDTERLRKYGLTEAGMAAGEKAAAARGGS